MLSTQRTRRCNQDSPLKWHAKRNGGRDLPSPAMLNDLVLVTSMSGVVTCYDAKNGKTNWIDRLHGAFLRISDR